MKISLLTPGRILRDRYKILDMIGHGGMGAVYLADDLLTDENIAVKQTFYNDEELAKAFYYEARLLARLKHPAFPKVTDFFAEDDSRFLVMEFIEGDDLSCRFDRKGRCPPLTFEEVIKIAKQLFEALSFLHAKNIVHRDIKPSNLIFTADEQLRILDFGAAKGSLADTTLYSIPVATPGYAPIEQIHGRGTDARSDIFSAAATLYHLLAGEPPVRVVNRELALKNKNADPLPELYKLNSYTPKYLSDTVKKAMSLDPHDRVQTASDFLQIINLEEARHQKHSAIISGLQSLSLEFNCRSSTKDIHFEFLEAPDLGLFANFAGYGLKSGDVSAQMASEIFQEFFNVNQSRLTSEDLMSTAAERTNEAIYSLANEFPSLSGMEAGMAALHIQGDIATVCCLGSCAIYQLDSDGNFQKYPSEDFTKSLEAALRTALIFDPLYNYSGIKLDEKIHCKPALKKMNPKTNFFDRLGSRNKIEINIKKTKIKPDTIFILYTGKLQNFLGADDFQNFLSGREFAGKNLNEIRNSLRSKRFFEKTGFVLVKI